MTEAKPLLPCPFCGEEPWGPEDMKFKQADAAVWQIRCMCGVMLKDGGKGKVTAAWNTRAPAPQVLAGEAVKRFDIEFDASDNPYFVATSDGPYIFYTDHVAQMHAKAAASVDLAAQVQDLIREIHEINLARMLDQREVQDLRQALSLLTTSEKKENGE